MLYGYFHRIWSYRELEVAVWNHVGAMWLTGMHYPDYTTIGRFIQRNRERIEEVFKACVRMAYEAGLVGMVVHAVDGTKVAAEVSKGKSLHREDLEAVLRRLDEVVEEKRGKGGEDIEEGLSYSLPEALQGEGKLEAFIRGGMKGEGLGGGESMGGEVVRGGGDLAGVGEERRLEGEEEQEVRNRIEERREEIQRQIKLLEESGTDHLNLVDRDARMMKIKGRVVFGYNAQVVVDGDSGLIVGADVVNRETDVGLLVKQIDRVKETLGAVSAYQVADGGYFSGEALHKAEERGYRVVVPIRDKNWKEGGRGFGQVRFWYEEGRDVWRCSEGGELKRIGGIRKKGEVGYKMYKCEAFRSCSVAHLCTKEKRRKVLAVSMYRAAIERQPQRQKDRWVQELMARRKQIVEPVFGVIKRVFGFRRWRFWGLEKVRAEWYWVCLAFNLRKLYRMWLEGRWQLA